MNFLFDLPHDVTEFYRVAREIDLEMVKSRLTQGRIIVSISIDDKLNEIESVDLPTGPHTLAPVQKVFHRLPSDHLFNSGKSVGEGYLYQLFEGVFPGSQLVEGELYFLQPPLTISYDFTSVKKESSIVDQIFHHAKQGLKTILDGLSLIDPTYDFLNEKVQVSNETDVLTLNKLNESYQQWCREHCIEPSSPETLIKIANEQFKHNIDWDNQWYGVKLN